MEVNQNQTFFHGAHSNLTTYLFLSKNIKAFQWFSKLKFQNGNNGNETKSNIFPWDIFKSNSISYSTQSTNIFQWLFLSVLFNFISKVTTNRSRDIKSYGTYANLTVFFLIYKAVHYLNDFWNLCFDQVYLKHDW